MDRIDTRSSEPPLWAQVLDDLRRRIARGEFAERFPTDRELVESYSVSRHTIREAVRRLQGEGVVHRHRGRGSKVVQPPIEQPVGALYSLFRSIEQAGSQQTSTVLVQERRRDPNAAAILGVAADEPLFHLERLRLVDGTPIAHDRAWLRLDLGAPLLDVDFGRTALYDELRDVCGVVPERGTERIRPVVPERPECELLGMAVGAPAFEVDRRTEWHGRPLEWRVTIIRGDRYVVRADWSEGLAESAPIIAQSNT